MLDYLTRTDGSPVVYLLRAWITVIAGTIVCVLLASLVLPSPDAPEPEADTKGVAVILLVFWPLVATGLIQLATLLARRLAPTYWHAAAATAFAFAFGLGLVGGPVVGVVYAWPFFIYAIVFLAWQLRSDLHGWVMTLALQVMVNLLPALFLK